MPIGDGQLRPSCPFRFPAFDLGPSTVDFYSAPADLIRDGMARFMVYFVR